MQIEVYHIYVKQLELDWTNNSYFGHVLAQFSLVVLNIYYAKHIH